MAQHPVEQLKHSSINYITPQQTFDVKMNPTLERRKPELEKLAQVH